MRRRGATLLEGLLSLAILLVVVAMALRLGSSGRRQEAHGTRLAERARALARLQELLDRDLAGAEAALGLGEGPGPGLELRRGRVAADGARHAEVVVYQADPEAGGLRRQGRPTPAGPEPVSFRREDGELVVRVGEVAVQELRFPLPGATPTGWISAR